VVTKTTDVNLLNCCVPILRPIGTDPGRRIWYNFYSLPKMRYHCHSKAGALALWNNLAHTRKHIVKPVRVFVAIGVINRVFRYQGWYQVTKAIALIPKEPTKILFTDPPPTELAPLAPETCDGEEAPSRKKQRTVTLNSFGYVCRREDWSKEDKLDSRYEYFFELERMEQSFDNPPKPGYNQSSIGDLTQVKHRDHLAVQRKTWAAKKEKTQRQK
jgi:hypothetical protein